MPAFRLHPNSSTGMQQRSIAESTFDDSEAKGRVQINHGSGAANLGWGNDALGGLDLFAKPSANDRLVRISAEDRSRRLVFADRAVEVGVREIAVRDEREGDRMVISSVEPDQVHRYLAPKWWCAPSASPASLARGTRDEVVARLSHRITSPARHRWDNRREGSASPHRLAARGARGRVHRPCCPRSPRRATQCKVRREHSRGYARSPANRWQRGALYWRHERRVDLVSGSGITVHDDKVAQFFLCSSDSRPHASRAETNSGRRRHHQDRPRRQDRGQRRRRLERTVGMPELVRSVSECLAVGFATNVASAATLVLWT